MYSQKVKMIKNIFYYFYFYLLLCERQHGCDTCSLTLLVFTEYPQLGYDNLNGQNFTTYDRDQDWAPDGNCAEWGHGAWWYSYACSFFDPNGLYLTPGTIYDPRSMHYAAFRGSKYESLRTLKLMFR